MEKMTWDGRKWGQEDLFQTNPDLADILGRMDLDFENSYVSHFLDLKFLDFQIPRSQDPGANILVARSWYQNLGPGSWFQVSCHASKCSASCRVNMFCVNMLR